AFGRCAFGGLGIKSVEKFGIGKPAWSRIGLVADGEVLRIFPLRNYDRDHRQLVFAREIEVALVVRRAAEYRTRYVSHENEIGDITGQLPMRIEWMNGFHAGIESELLRRLDSLFRRACPAAFGDKFRKFWIFFRKRFGKRVFGRQR